MDKVYSNIRGTSDFSPAQSLIFSSLNQKAREVFELFGYDELILPLLEEKGLFVKGVGEATDIAQRQIESNGDYSSTLSQMKGLMSTVAGLYGPRWQFAPYDEAYSLCAGVYGAVDVAPKEIESAVEQVVQMQAEG